LRKKYQLGRHLPKKRKIDLGIELPVEEMNSKRGRKKINYKFDTLTRINKIKNQNLSKHIQSDKEIKNKRESRSQNRKKNTNSKKKNYDKSNPQQDKEMKIENEVENKTLNIPKGKKNIGTKLIKK